MVAGKVEAARSLGADAGTFHVLASTKSGLGALVTTEVLEVVFSGSQRTGRKVDTSIEVSGAVKGSALGSRKPTVVVGTVLVRSTVDNLTRVVVTVAAVLAKADSDTGAAVLTGTLVVETS